jgi:hypothetical protein
MVLGFFKIGFALAGADVTDFAFVFEAYLAKICGLYFSFPGAVCLIHVMEKAREACTLSFSKTMSSS